MVIWDSRTIHANTPALPVDVPVADTNGTPTPLPISSNIPSNPNDKNDLLRIVGYICMTPTSLATKEMLTNRINIYERGLGTTHWPHNIAYNISSDNPMEIKNPFDSDGDTSSSGDNDTDGNVANSAIGISTGQKELIAGKQYKQLNRS